MVPMSRTATTVRTYASDIERIATEMPTGRPVRIGRRSGHVFTGTVAERPCVQMFEEVHGAEEIHAAMRMDDPSAPPWNAALRLNGIAAVEPLDA